MTLSPIIKDANGKVNLDFGGEWFSAKGNCSKCNLKGFIMHTENIQEGMLPKPCNCLVKTLKKRGLGDEMAQNRIETRIEIIDNIKTMIARVKPTQKTNVTQPGAEPKTVTPETV